MNYLSQLKMASKIHEREKKKEIDISKLSINDEEQRLETLEKSIGKGISVVAQTPPPLPVEEKQAIKKYSKFINFKI